MSKVTSGGRVIYFAGSIRGGRDDVALYARIIQQLSAFGKVLTEHVSDSTVTEEGETQASEQYIHDRDMAWLSEADVVIAEVTQPSLGVGYELGLAKVMGKPVLCLFRPSSGRRLSAMIRGAQNLEKKFTVTDYHEDEMPQILQDFFDSLN